MKTLMSALVAGVVAAGAASASEIDFATAGFDSTFGPISSPFIDNQTIDGIDFGFSVISGGANGYRQSTTIQIVNSTLVSVRQGLQFGVGGNGLVSLGITASEDLMIKSLTGFDTSNLDQDTELLPFDLRIDGVDVVTGGTFSQSGSTWDFADFVLNKGKTLTIIEVGTRDHNGLGGRDPNANAVLGSLDFDIATSQMAPVPLPAGLPLLLAGLGALRIAKRREG